MRAPSGSSTGPRGSAPTGLDRLVTVLRFGPEVSSNAEATKRLMDEARLAARLQNPGLVRVLGIGRVEQSVYVSTELVEGRSVAAILDRCRGEAFPFAADHALMIASRAAVALEFLHGKKDDAGASLSHGLVAPSRLVVAFDGEVKLKGLGLWPALRGTDLLPVEERRYLAPEQVAGRGGGARSDVYALGLVLLEALTGQAPDGHRPARRPRGRARHGHDRRAGPAAEAARGAAAPRPRPRARRALLRDGRPSQGDRRAALLGGLRAHDVRPRLLHAHALPRRHGAGGARARGGAPRGLRRVPRRGEAGGPRAGGDRARCRPGPPRPDDGPGGAALAPRRRPPRCRRRRWPRARARPRPSGRLPSGARAGRLGLAPGRGPGLARGRGSRGGVADDAGCGRGRAAAAGAACGSCSGCWPRWSWAAGRAGCTSSSCAAVVDFARAGSPEAAAAQARVRELEARIAQLEREKAEAETTAAEEARRKRRGPGRGRGKGRRSRGGRSGRRRRRVGGRGPSRSRGSRRSCAASPTRRRPRSSALAEASPPPAPTPRRPPRQRRLPTPHAHAGRRRRSRRPHRRRLPRRHAAPRPPVPTPAAAPTATPTPPAPVRRGALVDAERPGGQAARCSFRGGGRLPGHRAVRPAGRRRRSIVRALVDEKGRVGEVTVVRSSGQPAGLSASSEAALKTRCGAAGTARPRRTASPVRRSGCSMRVELQAAAERAEVERPAKKRGTAEAAPLDSRAQRPRALVRIRRRPCRPCRRRPSAPSLPSPRGSRRREPRW